MSELADHERVAADLVGIRELSPEIVVELLALGDDPLEQRIRGVKAWREAFLEGRLPPPGAWPGEALAGPVRRALEALGLASFARAQPELADLLLLDVVRAFVRGEAALLAAWREELARVEAEREHRSLRVAWRAPRVAPESDEARARAREVAWLRASERCAGQRDELFFATWDERARVLGAAREVFGELGALLGLGWDLFGAALHHRGWSELTALRELAASLPELEALVACLGRLRARDEGPSVTDVVVQAMVRAVVKRALPTPGVPPEVRGVERSGDEARMLPAEAAYLGHATLRWLWHARRSEQGLLTYAVEGVLYGREMVARPGPAQVTRPRPRPDKGPMIVCLDTSGSMAGERETVAKALVLEVLRTALRERREALLFSFSGTSEVAELRLELSERGLPRLLDFVARSFHGGTDVAAPLRQALARLHEAAWHEADVLLASDGEFLVPATLVAEIEEARALGTRFHGLLVGAEAAAMALVCDEVHRFTSWAALRA